MADNAALGQAIDFAESLHRTLTAVVEHVPPITVEVRGERVLVAPRIEGDELQQIATVPLTIQQEHRLNLRIELYCTLDGAGKYLTVDESKIALELVDTRAYPLFRFEYERRAVNKPAAHIQVHAHRDEIVYLASLRSRGKARQRHDRGRVTTLSELHLPVGGHRFRPCLEDVLEFAQLELGVDVLPSWRSAIQAGRLDWRRRQTATVARDSPEVVAETLRELGYEIAAPSDPPSERADRLTAY